MFKNINLITKSHSATDSDAYDFYKKNAKHRDYKNIRHYTHYSSVIGKIYNKIREGALEYEGGVYIKNFAYIIPQKLPQKVAAVTMENGKKKIKFNSHSDEHVYTLMFVNLVNNIKQRFWTMDGKFSKKFRHMLSEKLKKGDNNYKFSLDTLLKSRI